MNPMEMLINGWEWMMLNALEVYGLFLVCVVVLIVLVRGIKWPMS
jgi:hypothetical protein